MYVIPVNVKAICLTDKVNCIGNSALYCTKEIYNYPAKGKVTNTKRKCCLSGRCLDPINVNIGPVVDVKDSKVVKLKGEVSGY